MLNADSNISNSSACPLRVVSEIPPPSSIVPPVHKSVSGRPSVGYLDDSYVFCKISRIPTGYALNCFLKNVKLFRFLDWGAKVPSLWDGYLLHLISNSNAIFNIKIHVLRTISNSHWISHAYSDDYSDENSIDDIQEVEAALSMVDDEIANTEDALTEWSQSRGGSSVGASDYSSQTGFTGQYSGASSVTPSSYVSEGFRPMTDALLDRERRVLSTISEHTEERSRPTSFAQSGSGGSRPTSMYATIPATEHRRSVNLEGGMASPVPFHSRSATDPSGSHSPAPGATGRVLNVPGRRAGELIAFFEEKRAETGSPRLLGHTRTLSAPMGPRSPAPRSPAPRSPSPYTTTMSQSLSTFPYTGGSTTYGYGTTTGYGSSTYGYSSRPSSPTKSSRAGSSVSSSGPITTMSSVLSPPSRGTPLTSESRFTPTSNTFTQTRTTTDTYTRTGSGGSAASGSVTGTGSYSNTFTGFTSTATPTASSLRRPQTSPRSPLTSVRNIVAAWKERTPSLGKSVRSAATSPSPTQGGEGLFSLRRRAERGAARLRDHALGGVDEHGRPIGGGAGGESVVDAGLSTSGDATLSTSGMLPATFDIEELGQYASAGGTQEPLRIGLLWYLNVHAPPPYRWQRCQALLYPHMLLLSWIAPGGGRGIVTLDLLNCIEVRSVPSPMHPTAQDDVGTIAARIQSEQAAAGGSGAAGEVVLGEMGLMETLCPFQLLYSDGIERLGAESARERVRWVSAIWEVLDRAVSIPDRSSTRSPTGSIRTIRSMTSTTSSHSSGTGSASTVYVPPLDELSDIQSLSSSSGITRRPSLASAHHTRATDDGAVSSQGYLYPGDPRVIAPSRSSSIRRTSSMTDLDEEFASALRRARESRPGLGFGLGLAGGIHVGDGSPVTISSGPRLGGQVYMSPPPSARGGSDRKSRSSGSEVSSALSDDHFFAARSQTPSTSSFYSSSSFTHRLTDTTDTRTTTTTADSRTVTAGTGTGTFTATSTSGLVTDESVELASGSGTAIVTSSLSYRGTDSASLLGDSHTGSSHLRSPTSPSRTGLTRSGGVRRRTPRGSRSYTNSHGSSSESTDKENTYSGTYDYSLSTLESYSRTGTTPTVSMSRSRSRSVTPTPSSSSFTRSTEEEPYHRRRFTEPETDYYTAPSPGSPSTASFVSLSTIPSEYETAIVCDTEYETAPRCPSDVETEFVTAPVCTTPAPTEYVTAEVCASDVETEFETADCKCKVRESDEVSMQTPSEIPTIPSAVPSPVPSPVRSREPSPDIELLPTPTPTPRELELDAADVPLPPSDYVPSEPSEPSERAPSPTTLTPTSPTEPSLDFTPSSPEHSEIPTPSSIELSTESIEETSIPGPSPIPPLSDIGPTLTLSTITSPTESSVSPTPTSQVTPSVPSTVSLPISLTPSSPALPESSWGVETDDSYESSLLRASPSMASQAIPELPDNSFETSGLRPSSVPETTDSSLLAPTISDVSPSSPSVVPSTPSSISVTPITDLSPLSAPTEPSTPSPETTPTPSTLSLLPSQYSPLRVPRVFVPPEVTLTRSASMLSTVSSVSMSSSRMAPSEFELDVRTEPSLLGTPYTEARRLPSRPPSEAPLYIPLPPSPMPPTPEGSMRLSMTTPRGDTPSIKSVLETVQSDAPSSILTHDVNRLLQYLNDINEARGAENREMAENIQDIKGTLEDLGALLRERTLPEQAPPVPYKDVSVGRSVVSDASAGKPRTAPPPSARQEPRVMRAISLSPPPSRRERSPDTLSETMSFLSSHHSDDFSLMESESYPMEIPPSPSWPSSSPISSPEGSTSSSPTSAPPSSITPSEQLSDIGLRHLAVPRRGRAAALSPSPTPPPLSSSPSPSTVSSATARPTPPVSLAGVRDDLAGIRQQIANMLDAQNAVNRGLEELRDRPVQMPVPAPADHWDEFSERLRVIEEGLLRLLDRGRAAPPPRVDEEASSVSDGLQGILRGILAEEDAASQAPPTIIAPIPRQPGRSFDEELLDIIASGPPPPSQPVQAPPPLIPLIYRPAPRARPRSTSPVFESDLPPRPGTFPITRPPPPRETTRPRRPARPPRVAPQQGRVGLAPSETESQSEVPTTMADTAAYPGMGRRPETGPDIDFEREVQRRRRERHGGDGVFDAQTGLPLRPPTAPAGPVDEGLPQESWYQSPQQPEGDQPAQAPVPPPGTTFPQMPQFVPVASGPTVVQLPSTFNDILELLRDNRQGQLAGLEQQSEIITYLRGLNQWLERDVHDRHAEIQGVSARLEQTRDEVMPLLNQIAQAMRREGE
ncbi:hypothetical protein BD309DRAFT_1017792 [Dichomitus squalens]|nr:hypothetical protein BD309DRAFT_1017792 [Dichomitus squalens]